MDSNGSKMAIQWIFYPFVTEKIMKRYMKFITFSREMCYGMLSLECVFFYSFNFCLSPVFKDFSRFKGLQNMKDSAKFIFFA